MSADDVHVIGDAPASAERRATDPCIVAGRPAGRQAGRPGIAFACGTAPVVLMASPRDGFRGCRRIGLDNVGRRRRIDRLPPRAGSSTEPAASLDTRLKELSLAWNTSSS